MASRHLSDTINDLFQRCQWEEARQLLEIARAKDPENHWILTQLAVTFYEQKRYDEALKLLQESLRIVADCPLTLWNLAGTLEALKKPTAAIRIYTWLLESDKSSADDPCWESKDWTDSLKADCIYRLGGCFKGLGKKRKAEQCYRQYLNLLLVGVKGSYAVDAVLSNIQDLHQPGNKREADSELRKVVQSTLKASRGRSRKRRSTPPDFTRT